MSSANSVGNEAIKVIQNVMNNLKERKHSNRLTLARLGQMLRDYAIDFRLANSGFESPSGILRNYSLGDHGTTQQTCTTCQNKQYGKDCFEAE